MGELLFEVEGNRRGPKGKQGDRGLPGVNGLENDAAVAAYVTAPDSSTRAALTPVIQAPLNAYRLGRSVHVRDFGAKCNGVVDDTAAVQAFFTYLGANGGAGLVDGVMLLSDSVELHVPAKAFTVRSEGGSGSALFRSVKPERKNVFTFRNLLPGTLLQGFDIDGGSHLTTMHGISANSCQSTTFSDIRVKNYFGAALLGFTSQTSPSASSRNRFIRCVGEGGGVASNGIMFANSEMCGIYDCDVIGVDRNGGPGYGLQLKNGCQGCIISGGTVDGARAGVAFGYDEPSTPLQQNNTVVGVRVRNCTQGLLASRASGNNIQMIVDMGSDATCVNAAQLAGNFSSNKLAIDVLNAHDSATLVTVQEKFNQIEIPYISRIGTAVLVDFAASATYNRVAVGPIADKTLAQQSSAVANDLGTNNRVVYLSNQETHAMSNSQSSFLRFTSPTDQSSFVSMSHTAGTYGFRALGVDLLSLTPTNIRPGFQNAQSLGDAGRQYTEAWVLDGVIVRAPNGTAYRIGVNNSGAVTATVTAV